ncbi:blast:Protein scarlet [Drosophila guanche]|uniref:Blast:Protein scarlet n=1 Tax=Drosophila guanche TaxID=7266 RepID=A0A3B0JYG5_DROGU|nr:blast:Protein scarlet [Drosophila guanche]
MSDADSKQLIDVESGQLPPEQHELQLVVPVATSTSEIPSLDSTPKLSKRNSSERSLPLRSYSKWSPTEQGATLVWRDLCVYTNVGGSGRGMKRIINNSTGAIQPGTLMALMGSSGSGKTTLMSTLAFRQPAGTVVQGDILINGRRIGPFMHRISGYVYQDDLFIGSLTVLEHLNFMAHLRLDRRVSREERCVIINELLERTGLLSAAHTRIGSGDDKKVLSGGERKRLAFAVELLNNPVILFCDEPTTGLDSYSAQQLVATLYELAQKGTTILCTIHQPSSQLFDNFNNVMLLADGRVAFTGSPQHALSFFANHGYYCPEAYNPADFLIGVLATDPGCEQASQRSAQHLCDQFAVSSAAKQRDMLVNLEIHMAQSGNFPYDTEVESFRGVPWYQRFHVVWLRATLTLFRDPTIQWMRFIQKIAMAFIIGACFAGTTVPNQLGVQAVQGAVFIMISENTYHPMYSVLNLFPQGFPLFMRETRSGLYSTAQYYVANILALVSLFPSTSSTCLTPLSGLTAAWHDHRAAALCHHLLLADGAAVHLLRLRDHCHLCGARDECGHRLRLLLLHCLQLGAAGHGLPGATRLHIHDYLWHFYTNKLASCGLLVDAVPLLDAVRQRDHDNCPVVGSGQYHLLRGER